MKKPEKLLVKQMDATLVANKPEFLRNMSLERHYVAVAKRHPDGLKMFKDLPDKSAKGYAEQYEELLKFGKGYDPIDCANQIARIFMPKIREKAKLAGLADPFPSEDTPGYCKIRDKIVKDYLSSDEFVAEGKARSKEFREKAKVLAAEAEASGTQRKNPMDFMDEDSFDKRAGGMLEAIDGIRKKK